MGRWHNVYVITIRTELMARYGDNGLASMIYRSCPENSWSVLQRIILLQRLPPLLVAVTRLVRQRNFMVLPLLQMPRCIVKLPSVASSLRISWSTRTCLQRIRSMATAVILSRGLQ